MIPIGDLNQKANPYLSAFVIICCIVITVLLFMMQRAEALKENFYEDSIVSPL